MAGNATEYAIQAVTQLGTNEYRLQLDKALAATPAGHAAITMEKVLFILLIVFMNQLML